MGYYNFTNESVHGTYNIKAIASMPNYISAENSDQKDKFWYGQPVLVGVIAINPIYVTPIISVERPPRIPDFVNLRIV